MYRIRRLKIERTALLDALSLASGLLYSQTVVLFWRTVRKHNLWLRPSSLMRWHSSEMLHAHSADAVVQQFASALKSWRKRRKDEPNAHPPRRRRRFNKIVWKSSAIRLKNENLLLSNARGIAPVVIPWQHELPTMIEIGWNGTGYELRAVYNAVSESEPVGEKTAGVDLGEIHPAVTHDGATTTIVNGRYLRSLRRYQNKLKAMLSAKIDVKKRGSKRRAKLICSKKKQLQKLDHQIRDILHKQTSNLVSTLHRAGVQTVAIGDVRTIRTRTDLGRHVNQKIHQWLAGATRSQITYKAETLGMQVVIQDERYSSKTCPACLERRKSAPSGRNFVCKACGFRFHRDGVGSVNIRRMYLGSGPVVGAMASPVGVRFHPHLRRSSSKIAALAAA